MATQTLQRRVEMLEDQMEELRHLPSRVSELGAQFSHFQADVRGEFSALRADIAEIRAALATCARQSAVDTEFAAVRAEMKEGLETLGSTLRAEIRAGDEETRYQMRVLHEDVVGRLALLQEELRAGDKETRHEMRVLHEDVIGRLALLQEGLLPGRHRRLASSKTRQASKKKRSG
jgi:hypothetical protein